MLLTIYSCSVKKYIPEGKTLYRGGEIILHDSINSELEASVRSALEEVTYPEPNAKLFGLYPGLHYYYKAQQDKPGFINRFLNKKIGEEPVYFSDVNIENTKDLFQNRLENNGFFYGNINHEIKKDTADKTAKIDYTVTIEKPYRLAHYKIEKDSTDTLAIYDKIKKSLLTSGLQKEQAFNLGDLKKERERIDEYLKDKGYYFFNKDFLLFQADTNRYKKRKFDLFLTLKNNLPEKSEVPYVLDEVEIYPNVSEENNNKPQETVTIDSVNVIQGQKTFFKPKRIAPYVLLKPGQKYNPTRSKYTSRRLSSIGTYKFVNIKYQETDSITDSLGHRHLKSIITLSPKPRNAFSLKLRGVTKSNDFTGPGIEASYTNRNIFAGGEDFNLKTNFGYEKQFAKKNNGGSSSLQLGIKGSLLFPRLLFPWNFDKAFRYSIPKTKISAGMDFLNRSELYTLNSFSTSFGYIWDQNRFVTHRLDPIKIDYVNLTHASDRFKKILEDNPFLKRSFEQQFIAGLNYSFTYNELQEQSKKGRFYFQFNFDIAGNTLDLFSEKHSDGAKTFLGLKYAQYAKADVDLSYHYRLGERGESLVGHVFAGYGLPYGNSKSLPFVKQYFAGGPYSVRAFRIRSLGPGTYKPTSDENSYFDQAGDIRLEANLEYRFPIISILKGAVFIDAGNVWLQKENEALPGGKFTSDFIHEFGIGTGIGLRIDVQGFVIRFDLASPLKRPTSNWNFEYNHPVFNFGIGYPF